MTAQYWTITGSDMWILEERKVFDFKNLNTGEVVTLDCATEVKEKKFIPVTMPKIKPRMPEVKKETKKEKVKTVKSSRKGKWRASGYKGVSSTKTPGKFRASFWDKEKNKNIYLGTFDSKLLAAAALEDHKGNKKEAKHLRNEYEEGNCRPEVSEPKVVHKRIFSEDVSTKPAEHPMEQ